MKLALFILFFISQPILAETSIFLGAWSHHLNDESKDKSLAGKKYNTTHNLIAFEHQGWVGGYFRNSYQNDSYFAGKMLNFKKYESADVGIMLGFVTGYTRRQMKYLNTGDVMFMFSFYISPNYTISPSLLTLGPAIAFAPRWRFQ